MKGRRQVKESFLSLETTEAWIVYVCHSEGRARQKNVIAFEQGMVIDARRTSLCQELHRCWVFHAQQFHPANMTQLWEAFVHALTN
jgi:hypothetical protein